MRKPTLNDQGLKKVSPSALMNYYFPFDSDIDQNVLILAGARGNVVHECIEEFVESGVIPFEERVAHHEQELLKTGNAFSMKDYNTMKLQLSHFENYNYLLELDLESAIVEHYVDDLNNTHGYVDYHDDKQIIDWKTNSVLGKKEVEKYSIQMNLYRYMLYNTKYIDITDLKIVHLTKNEEMTPTMKLRKPEILLKIHQVELIPFEILEGMIEEVYNHINGIEKNAFANALYETDQEYLN
jgi:hypothetical protein